MLTSKGMLVDHMQYAVPPTKLRPLVEGVEATRCEKAPIARSPFPFSIEAELRRARVRGSRLRVHADLVPRRALVLELHHTVDERVNRIIATQPDVTARVPLRAT